MAETTSRFVPAPWSPQSRPTWGEPGDIDARYGPHGAVHVGSSGTVSAPIQLRSSRPAGPAIRGTSRGLLRPWVPPSAVDIPHHGPRVARHTRIVDFVDQVGVDSAPAETDIVARFEHQFGGQYNRRSRCGRRCAPRGSTAASRRV